MKKIPIKIISTQDANTLDVRFFPTDICNFNCSYCFPNSHDGKLRYPKNVDTVIKNFRATFDMYKTLGKERFNLTISGGGEPTLWPGLEKFCYELKQSHDVFVTLITNGSRTLRWWQDHAKCFDEVVMSCHHEYTVIDNYIEVADTLHDAGVTVIAQVLMDAEYFEDCISLIDRMITTSRNEWHIQSKEVVDSPGHDIHSYTSDELEYVQNSVKRLPSSDWILKHQHALRIYESVILFNDDTAKPARPSDIITHGLNYFKGWRCNFALESLVVLNDGTADESCIGPLFRDKKFNLFSEDFSTDGIELKSIICVRDCCSCQPETHFTKSKVD